MIRRSALVAAALAGLVVAFGPRTQDLSAQLFRAGLFDREGFALWSNAWYGGHHLLAYSVLYPPLGALLGARVVGALAAVAAATLFAALAQRAFAPRAARVAATWFAAGIAAQTLTGRIPFILGAALGLGALLATQRDRRLAALTLAVLTPLASPVAGLFVALAGVAWALGDARRRALGAGLAVAGLGPALVLAALFPEGGTEPFVASAFWPALVLLVAAVAVLGEHAALRAGAGLYAAGCLAAFVVPNPLGGNVVRLVALVAGPRAAGVLVGRGRGTALAVLALPLAYLQLQAPVRDALRAATDPATRASYFSPVRGPLVARVGTRGRAEIPFTRSHLEAAELAPSVALMRGWERQLDRRRNALFYGPALTAARYRAWLRRWAVRVVALPDAALDPSARAEARLVRSGSVPGLRELTPLRHWRLFAVEKPTPLADGTAASELTADGFALRLDHAGSVGVRVAFSPHFAVVAGDGCVAPDGRGQTRVTARRAGVLRVAPRFAPLRALGRTPGARCSTR